MEDSNWERQLALEAYRVAKETRNFEIALFWQRSNYFLLLSSAIAAAFFSLDKPKYTLPLAIFGFVVAILWVATNLGSKFWQARWEYRLHVMEGWVAQELEDYKLFSADWKTIQKDVENSFTLREHGWIYGIYKRLVMRKPSVSFIMTMLSGVFVIFWLVLVIIALWDIFSNLSCA